MAKVKKSKSKSSGVVKGHQKDLAKISGQVARRKTLKPGPKGSLYSFERDVIQQRAERKTRKSFK